MFFSNLNFKGKEGELPYTVKTTELASWVNSNIIIGYHKKEKTEKDKSGKETVVLDTNRKPIMIDDLTKPIYKKETSSEINKSILSILQLHHLVRYIACEKVKIKELKDIKGYYNDFNNAILNIKKKLIDKENTIIIFDEVHFSDTSY